jgi:hypothetical protein
MEAYKSREPSPYWPDSGNSQMTCKTCVVVALRLTRVLSPAVEGSGSGGMAKSKKYSNTEVEQRNMPEHVGLGALLIARSIA